MAATSSRSINLFTLFAVLAALGFTAFSALMTWLSWQTLSQYQAMQSWVEVPATITHAELKRHFRHDPGKKPSTTYQAVAHYEYEFGGRRFTGDRVSLHTGSDNLGGFQWNAYRELGRHQAEKKPFRCFVNPANPTEAVIYRNLRWEIAAIQTMFAAGFGAVGLGILSGTALAAWRKRRIDRGTAPADKPWMARSDWAVGKIRPRGGPATATPILAVIAIWWIVATLPLMITFGQMIEVAKTPWAVITLMFPAVGLVVLLSLFYQFARRRKFGTSVLELTTIPGVVGGKLAGTIRLSKVFQSVEGFRLRVRCFDRANRHDAASDADVIWQNERLVLEPLRDRLGGALAVPVLFAIPYTANQTTMSDEKPIIEWVLEVLSEMPGVDYKAIFEVPVFRTAKSRADFRLENPIGVEAPPFPGRQAMLRDASIVVEALPGEGVRMAFPGGQNPELALPLTVILPLWIAFVGALIYLGAFILFPIVVGALGLLLAWSVAHLWLYRSVVEARADGLITRGGLLGIGRQRRYPAEEVKKFTTTGGLSINDKEWNGIAVVLREGKQRTIASMIQGKRVPRAIVHELNAALRLKSKKDAKNRNS